MMEWCFELGLIAKPRNAYIAITARTIMKFRYWIIILRVLVIEALHSASIESCEFQWSHLWWEEWHLSEVHEVSNLLLLFRQQTSWPHTCREYIKLREWRWVWHITRTEDDMAGIITGWKPPRAARHWGRPRINRCQYPSLHPTNWFQREKIVESGLTRRRPTWLLSEGDDEREKIKLLILMKTLCLH